MEEIQRGKANTVFEIIIGFLIFGNLIGAAILKGYSYYEITKDVIILGIMYLALIFVIVINQVNNRLLFNNIYFVKRFYIFLILDIFLAVILAFMPSSGWVYLFIFVSLTIFSGTEIGMVGGMTLLTLTIMLSQGDGILYFEYLIPGIVGSILFSKLDERLKVSGPMILSLIFQLTVLMSYEILISDRVFTFDQIIIPVINIVLCILLILLVLKLLSFTVMYKESDRLEDVIDPDFTLLAELKNASKDEYDHTIYTAVLCSKLAVALGLDENLCKASGYYHKIGILTDDGRWDNIEKLLKDNNIPNNLVLILKEYIGDVPQIKSKETVILMFSDTVVSSIRYLFSKNKETVIDYEKLIDAIFSKKLKSGVLGNSDISYNEMNIIKNLLYKETLFYDFLR